MPLQYRYRKEVANIGRTGDKMRLLVVPGSHVVVSKIVIWGDYT
jgi:hypothetical protein